MAESTQTKICTKCGVEKSAVEFFLRPTVKSGRAAACAACELERNRRYREANKQKIKERKARTYAAAPEKSKARSTAWAKANADRVNEYAKFIRNKEPGREQSVRRVRYAQQAERMREQQRRWVEANADRARAVRRAYVARNRDRVNRHALKAQQRRRAQKLGSQTGPIDLEALPSDDCGICLQPLDLTLRHPDLMRRSLDHITPLSRGGSHVQENLQWAHLLCNIRKGNRLPD